MRNTIRMAAAAALLCGMSGVQAGPMYAGNYDLSDAGGSRGIWFEGDHRFTTVSGTFSTSGSMATLAGSVENAGLGGGFTYSVQFDLLCSSTVSNANVQGNDRLVNIDNAACGLDMQGTGGSVKAADVDGQTWDFWNFAQTNYYLTGTGNLEGYMLKIMQMPADLSKPFRMGPGADWDNAPPSFGGSGWFHVTDISCEAGKNCEGTTFNAPRGDFNFGMIYTGGGPTAVPVPGTLALLGLGLLGVGLNRRRR